MHHQNCGLRGGLYDSISLLCLPSGTGYAIWFHCPYIILLFGFWWTELIEMTEVNLLLRGTEKQYSEMRLWRWILTGYVLILLYFIFFIFMELCIMVRTKWSWEAASVAKLLIFCPLLLQVLTTILFALLIWTIEL